MGDAPDRITYNPGYKVTYEGADPTRGYVYIRADLHQAAIDRAEADLKAKSADMEELRARAVATIEDLLATIKRAEAMQRNIISHATMGGTTGEGMSLNDICVLITARRNELYQQAKAQADADKAAAVEAEKQQGYLPVPAPMTATQAARVPEVAAMIEAARAMLIDLDTDAEMQGGKNNDIISENLRTALAALEAKP